MARKKEKRRGGRGGITIPVAVAAGMIPLFVGTVQHGVWNGWYGPGDTALDFMTRSLTGYSPNAQGYGGKWNIRNMSQGALPIVVGIAVHKVAGMLGINRMLGRMRIPLIRI